MKCTLIFSAIFALAAAVPQLPVCECEQVQCIQSYPESCHCQNAAMTACFAKCGGVRPTLRDCGLAGGQTRPVKYQRCGSRGMTPCADGEVCIDDPARDPDDCGISCDNGNGYCVPQTPCGGNLTTVCSDAQICVDSSTHGGCDPALGGSDCKGICFTPQ